MTKRLALTLSTCLLIAAPAFADNFPLASCSGWDGTLVQRSGINTNSAEILGVVTQADFAEYCERDPGGETTAHGGKLSVAQCIQKYLRSNEREKDKATANCSTKTLTFTGFRAKPRTVVFPLPTDADTSCASGIPPLQRQFKLLCPDQAEKLGVE